MGRCRNDRSDLLLLLGHHSVTAEEPLTHGALDGSPEAAAALPFFFLQVVLIPLTRITCLAYYHLVSIKSPILIFAKCSKRRIFIAGGRQSASALDPKVSCVKSGDSEEETAPPSGHIVATFTLCPSPELAGELQWPASTNMDALSTFFFCCSAS